MESGRKSTEWMATVGAIMASVMPVLAVILDSLMGSGLIQNGTMLAVMGMAGSVLAALGYGASRTYLKGVDMKARALGKSQADT